MGRLRTHTVPDLACTQHSMLQFLPYPNGQICNIPCLDNKDCSSALSGTPPLVDPIPHALADVAMLVLTQLGNGVSKRWRTQIHGALDWVNQTHGQIAVLILGNRKQFAAEI